MPTRKSWLIASATVALMLIWAILVTTVAVIGQARVEVDGPSAGSLLNSVKQAAVDHPGNLAVVVLEDGRVVGTHFSSIGEPVDGDTLFQMASVSKWVAAWGVMTLVEAGKVELDAPVSRYLRRWQLPPSDYDNDQVTVRRLLSHTAGLGDGLGYCGFEPGEQVQALEQSLTQAADACPFVDGAVAVDAAAGHWEYSGGGFTLLQLLIEDASGQPFADYMEQAVLLPLGMELSTYRIGARGETNIAEFFDTDGSPAKHYRYTASAAASLYTSAEEVSLFLRAHVVGANGEPAGRGVLSPQTLAQMHEPTASLLGRPIWGLGMRLYAPNAAGGFIIGHDGGNAPAVNTAARIDPATGNGLVALSTGGTGIASQIASAWLRQRVPAADLPDESLNPLVVLGQAQQKLPLIIGGGLAILFGGIFVGWRARRNHLASP